MKNFLNLPFFALIFFSCTNSTVEKNKNSEINSTHTSVESNPITIEYINPVNGYQVSVIWQLEKFDSLGADGPAILKFKNIETKEVFYVTQHDFSEKIESANLKYINMDNDKVFIGNESFTQHMQYVLPKINSNEFTQNKGYEDYIPFFFKDVDFDKNDELVLVDGRFFEKGGFSNQIYNTSGYEMTEEPYRSFNNFYMNAAGESGNYNLTVIDYNSKTITQSYISGAATGGESIYRYNPNTKDVELISKSSTEWDDNSNNGGTITTITDKTGKIIKTTKSDQQ